MKVCEKGLIAVKVLQALQYPDCSCGTALRRSEVFWPGATCNHISQRINLVALAMPLRETLNARQRTEQCGITAHCTISFNLSSSVQPA